MLMRSAFGMAILVTGIGSPLVPPSADVAEGAPRPNVLIILTDDQRIGSMGVLPTVRQQFGAQGTAFDEFFVTTPLCCPSRASIFTGRYMHNHGVDQNDTSAILSIDPRTMLPYYFQKSGYRTAIFGKYFNPWPFGRDPPNFDRWAVTNVRYYNSQFNVQGTVKRIKKYTTTYVGDRAVDFIEDSSESPRPWFLYLAPTAVHDPSEPEARYVDARVPPFETNPAVLEKDLSDKPSSARLRQESLRETKKRRALQLRTLLSVDDLVARVMKALRRTGEEDTIAIFTSDNGYFWGEHGLYDKRFPYIEAIKVPFYLRWPGHVTKGAVDSRLAANIDIAPTVLEAAGITPGHEVDGKSLLQDWDRDRLLIEYARDIPPLDVVPPWAGLLTSGSEYVEYYNDSGGITFREYYDREADPWQLTNVLGDDDPTNDLSPTVLRALSEQLASDASCRGTDCP